MGFARAVSKNSGQQDPPIATWRPSRRKVMGPLPEQLQISYELRATSSPVGQGGQFRLDLRCDVDVVDQ